METYNYTSLSSPRTIRLLHLFPGKVRSTIRCTLKGVSLDSNQKYEAISYCWGDPTLVSHVECDDGLIPITKSCAEVLQRFRHKNTIRVLWIDAICIDQSSKGEIDYQVLLMGELYEKARGTLIWLGAGTRDTDLICKHIKKMGQINPKNELEEDGFSKWQKIQFRFHKRRVFRDGSKLYNHSSIHQMNMSWFVLTQALTISQKILFQKLWIIQSAGLTKSLIGLGFIESGRSRKSFFQGIQFWFAAVTRCHGG